jgi:hypothetical protein
VFEGGGFGVGVTVTPLEVEPWPVEFLPAGVSARPTRLGEMMPVAARTDAEIAVEVQRVQQLEARLAAYTAELVAELAARRPDSLDRQRGEPGAASPDWLPGPGREAAPGVSEFFADELAVILNCSRTAATRHADTSALLIERLPATWAAALADGMLDWPRARALAAELLEPARDLEPHVISEVEAAVLSRAPELSIRRLQAEARKQLLQRDATAGTGAAPRLNARRTSWCARLPTAWPSCRPSCRSRWPWPSATRSTPTPAWPRRTAILARSASCGRECWAISCCARGTPPAPRSPLT